MKKIKKNWGVLDQKLFFPKCPTRRTSRYNGTKKFIFFSLLVLLELKSKTLNKLIKSYLLERRHVCVAVCLCVYGSVYLCTCVPVCLFVYRFRCPMGLLFCRSTQNDFNKCYIFIDVVAYTHTQVRECVSCMKKMILHSLYEKLLGNGQILIQRATATQTLDSYTHTNVRIYGLVSWMDMRYIQQNSKL